MNEKNLPLSGIKVVELSTVVAAPTAARVLAAYGADVIKVEGLKGDVLRRFGDSYQVTAIDGVNPFFTLSNSGKKFIAIDLKSEEGMEAMYRLLGQADVFLSNVRGKSLKKLGLDYESLKDKFPGLICAHFTGFGNTGPDKDRPGYDTCAFWLRCGSMLDWQIPGSFPIRPVYGFGDMATSAQLVSGVLMALIGREKTGKGAEVSVSLLANGLWLNSFGIVSAQPPFDRPFMVDESKPFDAFSDYYQCKDGSWIGIFANEYTKEREKLAKAFDMPELLTDPECANITIMRESHALERMSVRLREVFRTKTREEWCDILRDVDIAYEKLMHYNEIYLDEHAKINGYLEDVVFDDGSVTVMPAPPIEFEGYDKMETVSTGRISEHASEILEEAGYSEEEIANMIKKGIIG